MKLKVRRQGRSPIKRALRRGHKVRGTVRVQAADVFDNIERAKASAQAQVREATGA